MDKQKRLIRLLCVLSLSVSNRAIANSPVGLSSLEENFKDKQLTCCACGIEKDENIILIRWVKARKSVRSRYNIFSILKQKITFTISINI
jgi:hypothetical protein